MLKKIKTLKHSLIVVSIALVAVVGVVFAYDTVVNNYYGNTTVDQTESQTEASFGSATAVDGICNGSEPTTQLCNVNAYELESQTTLTAADGVFSDDLTVSGDTNVETLTQGGGVNSTTTPASMTLKEGDFDVENLIDMNPTVGSITVTLPATSTITTVIPNVSDYRQILIRNATTTAGVTITLAAGTGWDLQTGTSTAVIYPGDYMHLNFFREVDTDISGDYNTAGD